MQLIRMKYIMSEEKFDDFDKEWNIELDKIIQSRELSSIVKQLAHELKGNPYKTVGSFFDNLSNVDLDVLMEKLDNDDLEEILLITELLARAEGAGASDLEEITRNVNVMSIMIAGEALSRKGIVEAYHHNMSFGEDFNDKPIFKKIDQDE
jgi:hypothetical protein